MKRKTMATSLDDFSRREIASLERRLFMQRGLSLGALTMLSGCDVTNQENVQKVLWAMSRWNDRVQGWIFDPDQLAPEFPESRITQPFPFNAFYSMNEALARQASDHRAEEWHGSEHHQESRREEPVQIAHASGDTHLVAQRAQNVVAREQAEEIRERPQQRADFVGPHRNETAQEPMQRHIRTFK